jgi:tetratricopeptide (TPR) repeat protein
MQHDPSIEQLLDDLKQPDEGTRSRATQALWQRWFFQKGLYGLELLERSQALLEQGRLQAAEAILTDLINDQPDFAEAWNRRAVLYYTQERYQDAAQDCEAVIKLNPAHFGAMHGLGRTAASPFVGLFEIV